MAVHHTPRTNLHGRFPFGSFPFFICFTGTRCLCTDTLENRASNCNGIRVIDYNISGVFSQPTKRRDHNQQIPVNSQSKFHSGRTCGFDIKTAFNNSRFKSQAFHQTRMHQIPVSVFQKQICPLSGLSYFESAIYRRIESA